MTSPITRLVRHIADPLRRGHTIATDPTAIGLMSPLMCIVGDVSSTGGTADLHPLPRIWIGYILRDERPWVGALFARLLHSHLTFQQIRAPRRPLFSRCACHPHHGADRTSGAAAKWARGYSRSPKRNTPPHTKSAPDGSRRAAVPVSPVQTQSR